MSMTKWSSGQRRHFDQQVEAYDTLYGRETPFHAGMTQHLFELNGIHGHETVLDIGCGFGRMTIPLLRLGCRVTALDISENTLQALHRRVAVLHLADHFTPMVKPAEQIDFQQSFTLVTGRGILHHLEDPLKVMRRVHSALVPGGRAIFVDPNPFQPLWIPFIVFHPAISWSIERKMWRGTPRHTRRLLTQAGFTEVAHHFMGLVPPPLWGLSSRAATFERWIGSVPFLRSLALYITVSGRRPTGR
jgi:2-polyprenyl-3-methyl-5-hydroxy-6-metoxy-1,4-benzoquinol methylase